MNSEDDAFKNLPGFKETIARLAHVPPYREGEVYAAQFDYLVRDESNNITYKVVSSRTLSPGDLRRALARAFSRTDAWPDEAGVVEIIA